MADNRDAFGTGIDIASEQLSPAEAESMKAWYENVHGSGNLDLVRYVPFTLENNPLPRIRHPVNGIRQIITGIDDVHGWPPKGNSGLMYILSVMYQTGNSRWPWARAWIHNNRRLLSE